MINQSNKSVKINLLNNNNSYYESRIEKYKKVPIQDLKILNDNLNRSENSVSYKEKTTLTTEIIDEKSRSPLNSTINKGKKSPNIFEN